MPVDYFRPNFVNDTQISYRATWFDDPEPGFTRFMTPSIINGTADGYINSFGDAGPFDDLFGSPSSNDSYETTHTAEWKPLNRLLEPLLPLTIESPQYATPMVGAWPSSTASRQSARLSPSRSSPGMTPPLSSFQPSLSTPLRSSATPTFFTPQSFVDFPASSTSTPCGLVDSHAASPSTLPSFPPCPRWSASPVPCLANPEPRPSRLEIAQKLFAQEGLRPSPIIHIGPWTGIRISEIFSNNPVPQEILSVRLIQALNGLPIGREDYSGLA